MTEEAPKNEAVTPADAPPAGADQDALKERIVAALKTCYDPEIPVDIYELGLIYTIDVADDGVTRLEMTLTSPACPVAGTLPPEVEQTVAAVDGVSKATVDVVWDPPWDKDMMSEAAKLQLNLF